MEDPSLLDLLKEKINLRRIWKNYRTPVEIASTPPIVQEEEKESAVHVRANFPWKSLLAFLVAIAGQLTLNPQGNNYALGVFLYIASVGILLFAILTGEWKFLPSKVFDVQAFPLSVKRVPFFLFIISLLLAFLTLGGNKFTGFNVFLWMAAIASGVYAFWIPENRLDLPSIRQKVIQFFENPVVHFRLDPWKLLILGVFCVAAYFHLYQLNTLPLEMTSDHTEKLMDINQIFNGNPMIFFSNNGGREPIHFYLSALLVKVFGTGMNFFTLKLGMAIAFLFSLVYVYKLGCEVGSRWTGLFFMLLLGFAAWPNIIARAGMRLVLAPVFTAPTLYYFLRGLSRSSRNDFILTGLFLGAGLLGYTAFRIVPVVLIVGMLIYMAYHRFNKSARSVGWAFLLVGLFAFVVFLPLFRYALENPQLFTERMFSRISSTEVPLPDNLFLVFLKNLWNAMIMPFWKSGTAWVISVTDKPSLDIISAALYLLGFVLAVLHWLRSRSWLDLFLLVSIPLLMLPSILSLAFPVENPSQSRAGAAMIPIFLLAAMALESLLRTLWSKAGQTVSRVFVVLFGLIAIIISANLNYDLALVQYPDAYRKSTWNSSEMGEVIQDFTSSFGNVDNVWVLAVPYWVDTRLVAMHAGYIDRDFQLWAKDLEITRDHAGAKLFIVKEDDIEGMAKLRSLYPDGFATLHTNPTLGRDFYVYLVGSEGQQP